MMTNEPIKKKHSKNTFWMLLGLGVFAFLLFKLDIRQSLARVADIHPGWAAVSVGFLALTQILGYHKWRLMYHSTMEDKSIRLLPIFCSVLVLGMLTPARSGDVIASLSWKKIQGKVLAWSIFHRISEGLTTIAISFVALGLFFSSFFENVNASAVLVFLAVMLTGLILILNRRSGLFLFELFSRFLNCFRRWFWVQKVLNFEEAVKTQMISFYDTFALFRKGHVLLPLIGVTLLGRTAIIAMNAALLYALGVSLPPMTVVAILAATWVSSFFSPTPGGIGVGDIAPSMMLKHYGYEEAAGAFIMLGRLMEFAIITFWSSFAAIYLKIDCKAAASGEAA